ncbi:GNAT family N-acetyltransferase [Pelagibius sp. Alg239-R121]|uniref:GNAT family N-acetyltransferase n=1 Tax=Pelagibius sp. Alg239-R121 TaxID=2993448 RepID=UPI0024A67ACB|nr:GNAT family N-acetyltransferase [Pelagibius sp. Alg239-R121]
MTSEDTQSVTRSSSLALVEITAKTVRKITALKVAPSQQRFVANNATSIAEAYFERGAWFRAIHADDTPVGFVMLFDPSLSGAKPLENGKASDIWLWRYMIAEPFQRHGFGRSCLDLIVEHARSRPGMTDLLASYVPGPGCPRDFYLRYGFTETGRTCAEGSENEISLPL